MADLKISQLTAGDAELSDEVAVRRDSSNYRVPVSDIADLATIAVSDALETYADSAVATHAAATTGVHGAGGGAKLAVMHGGGRNIYVQETEPTAEFEGDVWIDTSGA